MEEREYLYIADTGNHCIKLLSITEGTVSELVGRCEVAGFKDGPKGVNRLNSPQLVGVSSSGNVYIMDSGNRYVRIYNQTSETLLTLDQGACREIQGNATIPQVPYAIRSKQYSRTAALNVKTVVCVSEMLKLFGEPSEHLYVKPELQCLDHYTSCGNRSNPLVS
mmetsp:Transcript_950/g.2290  ORF Transcript_950/g.2290 Transcript_950/m.2290 type:complete len:165 (+) Transcript_950:356-850(+)